ncbi:MAG TPA: WYL domain-containing protein [Pyrinomonadaceae bacterium]|nr:WYL domain-containing protein [Pyrinomonadaceae bacterium]
MRADRLLSIVLLLQAHQQMTSRDLAERLEVSERTIHRDMEALSGAGIPVIAARGSGGGWSLLGEYRTTLTGLTETEIQSLFVNKPTKLLADLRLEKAADGALLKLLASLPTAFRQGAERARQRIYVDVSGWSRREEAVPLLPILQEALWLERGLRINYERGENCESVERLLGPLGLVAKGSVWYLVAAVDGSIRSYRVSRIVDAEILETPAPIPFSFNLAEYWEQSASTFKAAVPNYRATFWVSPSVLLRLRFAGRFARVNETEELDSRGWKKVYIGFDVEEMACEYAVSFGPNLEVIEPTTLREKVVAMTKATLDFYRIAK